MNSEELKRIQLNEYRQYLICEEKSKATIEKYIRDVGRFLKFVLSELGIEEFDEKNLTKEMVMKYKCSLSVDYLSTSINSMLAALNSYLTFVGKPECHVKLLKIQKRVFCDRSRELNRDEYIQLVQEAQKQKQERLMLVMETICGTGIRISELGYITTEAAKKGFAQVNCKGKERFILLPIKLQEKLKEYCSAKHIEVGPVFITKSGKPIDRSNVWREMNQLCGAAGICANKVFPHNMRHLFARTYYENEKDIVHLADILGHSSIETTRIYTMTSSHEYEKMLNKMELII